MTDHPTCETCKFWDHDNPRSDWSPCREDSPQLMPDHGDLAQWPRTHRNNWCGKHRLKPKERDDA